MRANREAGPPRQCHADAQQVEEKHGYGEDRLGCHVGGRRNHRGNREDAQYGVAESVQHRSRGQDPETGEEENDDRPFEDQGAAEQRAKQEAEHVVDGQHLAELCSQRKEEFRHDRKENEVAEGRAGKKKDH